MFEVESCIHGFHVYGAVWKKRFSAAVAKEAIEKIPLQFQSRNLAQWAVMCRGKSRVSAHRGDLTLRHTGVHYALNNGSHSVEL